MKSKNTNPAQQPGKLSDWHAIARNGEKRGQDIIGKIAREVQKAKEAK